MSTLLEAIGTILLIFSVLVFLLIFNLVELIGSMDISPDLMLVIIIALFVGIKIGKRRR